MTSMLFQFHQGLLSNLSCYKFCISVAGTIRDELDTERQLEELAMGFRLEWITLAHALIAGVMKSPPQQSYSLVTYQPLFQLFVRTCTQADTREAD